MEATDHLPLSRKIWYLPLIRGIVGILFGILVLAAPLTTVLVAVIWLGVFWLIDGIVAIVDGVRRRGHHGAGWETAFGVIGALAGIFLIIHPLQAASTLVLIAAIWAIIGGIILAVSCVRGRGFPGWGWGVAAGVVMLIFGITVAVQPAVGITTFVLLVGWYAIITSIGLIVLAISMRAAGKKARVEQ